jgi:adenylate cyclase
MELSKTAKKCLTATAVGLVVALTTLALQWSGLLAIAELKALDHLYRRYADPAKAGKDLVLVAIDEASLETFGRWPWPRDRHGYMVHFLKEAGAKAIVFDVIFSEPDKESEEYDQVFADELRAAGNVFLSFLMQDETAGDPGTLAQEIRAKATMPVDAQNGAADSHEPRFKGAKLPTPLLAQAAHGLGSINLSSDFDGTARRLPLLSKVGQDTFPQISAAVARYTLGADRAVVREGSMQLGSALIPLTREGDVLLNWHGSLENKAYAAYSSGAVLRSFTERQEGKPPFLDPALFKDKIVFIAATAAGTYDLRVTPLSPFTPGVLIHMTALDNILRHQSLRQAPAWVSGLMALLLCLGTAWMFMLLQRQTLKITLIVGLAALYYGIVAHAFAGHLVWLALALPEGGLAVTFGMAATVEYLTEGKQRRQIRAVFDKYMAADVVEEIMRNPEEVKLGGEKKELSMFFSDVAGFTTISESLDPEALVVLLNKYLSAMTDIVLAHRGNVNKYLGDGIMAIFGAPRGDPKHATLACYAALESQKELTRLREEWKAQGYAEIGARIGINSGPVVVGNIGSQVRLEYTVMGDAVNLASRLEGANKFYETLILLGPRTYELAREDIEAREVDLMRVKGKKQPVAVYELLARKGELPPEKRRVVDLFLEGLALYKQRNFSGAKDRFEASRKLDPSDGPSHVYLGRAQEYLASPPPPDWDGVYVAKSK